MTKVTIALVYRLALLSPLLLPYDLLCVSQSVKSSHEGRWYKEKDICAET